ncbi:VOC family protein [Streptomyces orinoci]|uniref:VOC family protein n=1 Tax=Streptomyces orinoci TaxID=67339 RepID=A0ABV3K6U6_STRON|nr:VOC family protein [Streptomyces orinoci]
MPIELNHTIVQSRDKHAAARFVGELLGLEVGAPFGPFVPLVTDNGVTLDYATSDRSDIPPQHYAFLVSEKDFDQIFGRIQEAGVTYYPSPALDRPGEINHRDGGRGAYFRDLDGHVLEIITRPYGSGPAS